MEKGTAQQGIQLAGVSKSYGHVQAIDDVSLSVRPGELVGVVGPDGAGKTTLARLAAGVLRPDSGTVTPKSQGRVGYLAGRFSLYPELTVWENLTFFASLYGMARDAIINEGERLLAWVGLTPFRNRLSGDLSGGMRQKLALICALVHQPPVLILDEPTTAVDPAARADFWALLRQQAELGRAILVTTPYMDEAETCHRVGLLQRGRLLALDSADALKARLPYRMGTLSPTGESGADSARDAHAGRRRSATLAAAGALPGCRWAEPLGQTVRVALAPDAPFAAPPGYTLVESPPKLEDVYIWLSGSLSDGPVADPPPRRTDERQGGDPR